MNRTLHAALPRPAARLLTTLVTLGAATALTLPAHAAGGPRVDLAEAVASLPTAAELPPGTVVNAAITTVAKPTGLNPCNLADAQRFNLRDNGAAIGIYSTASTAPVSQLAQWVVSTRVFGTAKGAHDAIARLGVAEKSCPALATSKGMTFRRTWSARYVTGGGWHGYHTVDVITVAGRRTQLRHIAVYLQRGNALIQVDEIAAVVGHNSVQQENRRLAVQHQLAARVDVAALS